MNKTIKILSIISAIFSCVGLIMAVALLTFLWKPINHIMGTPPELENALIVPIGTMIYLFGCATVALFLLATYESRRFVAIEIVSIAMLVIFFPFSKWFFGLIQQSYMNAMGTIYIAGLGNTTSVLNFSSVFASLSESVSLVLCGMRIARKIMHKTS